MRLPDSTRLPSLRSLGIPLETTPEAFGEFRDSSDDRDDMTALRRRLAEDGYLLLRALLDPDIVAQAQREAVESLAARGLVSRSSDRLAVRGACVSTSGFESEGRRFPSARRLALAGRMSEFYARFLDTEVRAFDHLWMRFMAPGQATGPHCDIVYMGRGTTELYTSWIPLTAVTLADGPLLILEHSHHIERLRSGYGRMDIDKNNNWRRVRFRHGRLFRGGDYSRDPRRLRREFSLRWLTSEFDPGDVVIFTPYVMHGSLDNLSKRFRISVDARYQRAADPIDERWIGDHPIGHSR